MENSKACKVRTPRLTVVRNFTSSFLLTEGDATRYKFLSEQILAELNPTTALEMIAAEQIVSTHWRLNRIVAIAHNLQTLSEAAPSAAFESSIGKAQREEMRLSKMLTRARKEYSRLSVETRSKRIARAFAGPITSQSVQ